MPVPANRFGGSRRPDARDRDLVTWGPNLLTAEMAEVVGVVIPTETFNAAEQLAAFQAVLPTMDAVTTNELNYCVIHGAPAAAIQTAWNNSVARNGVDPIKNLYNQELRGVDAYAKSIGQLAWHIIPPRFESTTWMVEGQTNGRLLCDPTKLVYARDDPAAIQGRTRVRLQPMGTLAVVAPERVKRQR